MLFECDGVDIETAKEALRLAAQKLPIKTKFVIRRDYKIIKKMKAQVLTDMPEMNLMIF